MCYINEKMKRLLKKAANALGVRISRKQFDKHTDAFVTLRPEGIAKGNVLLAYIIDPFLLISGQKISNSHTHFWESTQIAKTFLDLGYTVDAISYLNSWFKPTKKYSFFISARTNFQRIAQQLNKGCVKIANLDMAHWVINNHAAHQRCFDLHKRRNAVIRNYKLQEENFAIEYADYATVLGNEFTIDTYRYAGKPLFRVPLPTCATFPSFEDKNFNACKKSYLWFGSQGFVHKGLDLVLEAFAQMPEYKLTVCGPIDQESDFKQVFFKELYRTSNIKTVGWTDIESKEFSEILMGCTGIVFPSCAEGGGGCVITCMQGGLIPIVTYEASVDVRDEYGVILKTSSVDEIKKTVQYISGLDGYSLKRMSEKAREFAKTNHSKDAFAKRHRQVVEMIIELEEKKKVFEKDAIKTSLANL